MQTTARARRRPKIYNHDIMSCTADGVLGNHLYSGRVLGATTPADLIQLHPDLKPEWPWLIAHYARVGLEVTEQVIWDVGPGPLADHPEHEVSVFFFGPNEHAARPDQDRFETVDYINSKNNFMALAETLGVAVPRTLCLDSADQVQDQDQDVPLPCYIKAAVSVSGVGIYRCADRAELADACTRFDPATPVQVQAEVTTDVFLNLQYESTPDGVRRLAATEQVLDGPVHQGNRHPVENPPWDCVEPMAQWLHERGMRDVFAFDVAELDGPDGKDYLAIECNPRFNGASYPTCIAERLDIEHWLARAFATRHRTLGALDLSGIEYDPASGEGVILVNWGPILVGKVLFMLAGSTQTQDELALELRRRL